MVLARTFVPLLAPVGSSNGTGEPVPPGRTGRQAPATGEARAEGARCDEMFERFTDRARRVVVLAQEEARMLGHNYIGTEHLLLGLIHEGGGIAAKALESLGIELRVVRAQVEDVIGRGQSPPTGHVPFTPRAK